jgi:hypothetical protein
MDEVRRIFSELLEKNIWTIYREEFGILLSKVFSGEIYLFSCRLRPNLLGNSKLFNFGVVVDVN